MSETFSETQSAELGSRRLWVQLLRARLMDEASAGFEPDPEEVVNAWMAFCKRHQLDPENPAKVPPDFTGCPPNELKAVVEREVRISKWKKALFEPQAAEHFERRKPALDRVVYSLLRVKEAGLARELWFRIKEGEASFADLAPKYASGNEVYTAGIVGPSNTILEDVKWADFEKVLQVNLYGAIWLTQAVIPAMKDRKYGRIVHLASIAGKEGNPNASHYSVSKAGVIALTKSLAKEVATKGVLVNAVAPAAAKTAMFATMAQTHIDYMLSKIPMGRFVEVDEIAAMVSWLSSEDCSFTTGSVFDITGGRSTY